MSSNLLDLLSISQNFDPLTITQNMDILSFTQNMEILTKANFEVNKIIIKMARYFW